MSQKFITKDYLLAQLRAFKTAILDEEYATKGGAGDEHTYTYSIGAVSGQALPQGVSAQYQLYQTVDDGEPSAVEGSVINIPKDYFLNNVSKITLNSTDATNANAYKADSSTSVSDDIQGIVDQCPQEVYTEGEVFLKFEVVLGSNPSESGLETVSTIYLSISDIIPEMVAYTAGDGIDIDNNNVVSVKNQVQNLTTTGENISDYSDSNLKIVLNEYDNTFYKFSDGESGEDGTWTEMLTLEAETDPIDFSNYFDDSSESGLEAHPVTPEGPEGQI